jgi:hypothetical protein
VSGQGLHGGGSCRARGIHGGNLRVRRGGARCRGGRVVAGGGTVVVGARVVARAARRAWERRVVHGGGGRRLGREWDFGGRMVSLAVNPRGLGPTHGTGKGFFGRAQPCRGAKLVLSFSPGPG